MSTPRPAIKKVSLADIARRAGVSTNTVSRVVRGDPEVSEKTRARIAKLVDELGYVPNYAARALAAKRTNVLQVVLAAPMFHGHGRVLLSILNASSQAGYHVSLSPTGRTASSGATLPPSTLTGSSSWAGRIPRSTSPLRPAGAFRPFSC